MSVEPSIENQRAAGVVLHRMVRLYVIEHQISNAVRVYVTGKFVRINPPRPKVGPIETAKKWKTAKGAMEWRNKHAAQYDMRVCRLPNGEIRDAG